MIFAQVCLAWKTEVGDKDAGSAGTAGMGEYRYIFVIKRFYHCSISTGFVFLVPYFYDRLLVRVLIGSTPFSSIPHDMYRFMMTTKISEQ